MLRGDNGDQSVEMLSSYNIIVDLKNIAFCRMLLYTLAQEANTNM